RGSATNTDTRTRVEIAEPSAETFDLPLSVFPSAHTMDLIDRAIAGESFVETRLYDGDNEAGKLLTTTAIITPVQGEATPPAPANPDGSPSLVTAMRDMRRWRVAESYYNSDSKLDGLPLFQTSYILYENGVSDDIMIDNGDYAFSGSLSKLELASAPDCRNRS
ncbi:cell envelope integrity EipB family protein, partial [Aurantimonas litoralis]|nr:cell envelope integrity EipB family protein [Aurantimonas litoralis]